MTTITLGRLAQKSFATEQSQQTGGLKTLLGSLKQARARRVSINEIRSLRRQGLMDIEIDQIPAMVDGMLAKRLDEKA